MSRQSDRGDSPHVVGVPFRLLHDLPADPCRSKLCDLGGQESQPSCRWSTQMGAWLSRPKPMLSKVSRRLHEPGSRHCCSPKRCPVAYHPNLTSKVILLVSWFQPLIFLRCLLRETRSVSTPSECRSPTTAWLSVAMRKSPHVAMCRSSFATDEKSPHDVRTAGRPLLPRWAGRPRS